MTLNTTPSFTLELNNAYTPLAAVTMVSFHMEGKEHGDKLEMMVDQKVAFVDYQKAGFLWSGQRSPSNMPKGVANVALGMRMLSQFMSGTWKI